MTYKSTMSGDLILYSTNEKVHVFLIITHDSHGLFHKNKSITQPSCKREEPDMKTL